MTLNDQPKVSVLIPAYHTREAFLREALESILAQSFKDFELLVLNDSPDDTHLQEVVDSYQDSRIRYYVNERNLGITPSRNRLLDLARGEYIAIMDHDDISLPNRFAEQVTFLDAHPDYGVVGCRAESFPQAGHLPSIFTDDAEIRLALMTSCAIIHPATMMRASVLKENGIRYEERFSPAEDYALFSRLIPFTRFHNLPKVLFRYRWHAENTSKTQEQKMKTASGAIHLFTRLSNPSLYQEFLDQATQTTRVRLFGFIPLLKIEKRSTRTKVSLFDFIPIWTTKLTIKLKH